MNRRGRAAERLLPTRMAAPKGEFATITGLLGGYGIVQYSRTSQIYGDRAWGEEKSMPKCASLQDMERRRS